MRYCIVVSKYFPSVGGVQYVTQNLAEGLVKRGNHVTVITSLHGIKDWEKYNNVNGVEIVWFNVWLKKGKPNGDIKELQRLACEESSKCDAIVMVCFDSALVMPLLPLVNEMKCKRILYMHNIIDPHITVSQLMNGKPMYRLWNIVRIQYLLKKCKGYLDDFDLTIHIANDIAYNHFVNHSLGKNVILHSPAEDAFFVKTKKEANVRGKYIVYVANYAPLKNQGKLVKAFYKSQYAEKLIMIGSEQSEYYYKLKRIINKKNKYCCNKEIELLVSVGREETIQIMKNAYLFVMPSLWEGLPIVLIESIASGTPFIASDVGNIADIRGGIVLDKTTPKSISIAIDEMYSNERLYNELQAEGIQYSSEFFSRDVYFNKLDNFLSEL